jgi:Na+/proline symporter
MVNVAVILIAVLFAIGFVDGLESGLGIFESAKIAGVTVAVLFVTAMLVTTISRKYLKYNEISIILGAVTMLLSFVFLYLISLTFGRVSLIDSDEPLEESIKPLLMGCGFVIAVTLLELVLKRKSQRD